VNFKRISAWAWCLGLCFQAMCANALTATEHQTIADAAAQTQSQCFKEMYRDPNAYAQCVRNMHAAEKKSPLRRLGIDYFGFVGGLSYMRVGHMNADQIAAEFLQTYRPAQKKLGISDEALCSTIPGNCSVRIAQTKEMEAAPPKRTGMRVRCIGKVCSIVPAE
jgi:hypothetical protein